MDPILVTTVEKETSDTPLLIIDHKGIIGNELYEKTNKELMTAFVSSKKPERSANLIYIPYKHRIPEIPNGSYSIIIYVSDNEKDISEITKKCIVKAKEDGIPFIFIVDYKMVDEKLIEKIIALYEETYVIVVGEFFGQGDTLLDAYILQAGTMRTIKLPHMGLRKTRPVLFADGIQGILQTIFGSQKRQRITLLYPHHEYTDLSVAHMLQKMDPLIHIDFLKDGKKRSMETRVTESLQAGHYFFDKEYPIQEKIIDVYTALSAKRKTGDDAYVYKEEMKPLLDLEEGSGFLSESTKKWGRRAFFYLAIFLLFPIVCIGISALIAGASLHTAKVAIDKGDIRTVRQQVALAHATFAFDDVVKRPLLLELKTVGLGSVSQQLDNKITTGRELTKIITDLFTAQETIQNVISGQSKTPQADIATVVSNTRASLISLQNITATDTDEKELLTKIGKYQQSIAVLSGTVSLLPHMLSTNGKHTYVILFQNNVELRPGGGVVDAYGLLTFDHGKMSDFVIHDVTDADGQLRKHIDPAFAIRRYMGIVHQYLRDSTFDPDYVVDAQKASDMLQTAIGQKVDGVVAVDLTFVQDLLSATGPLYISEQHMTVTKDNFFTLAVGQGNRNTHFLENVFVAVWNKLQSGKQINMSILIQKSQQLIQEKHLLFALANITDQNQLSVTGVSSSLWDPRPQNSGVINDYMGISEANIGANNANYFVKRHIKQSVSIDGNGTLQGEVHVTYSNTSKENQLLAGDYKNYVNIIVPKDTTLTGISVNGQSQATRSAITDPLLYESKGFKAPSELEISQTHEFGKTLYGFLVTIPAESTKTIDVRYEHTQKINLSNPVLHYSLYLYKQPGANNDPFSLSFNFPLEYSILSARPANGDGNSDYTLDMPLSSDKIISVDLTKK